MAREVEVYLPVKTGNNRYDKQTDSNTHTITFFQVFLLVHYYHIIVSKVIKYFTIVVLLFIVSLNYQHIRGYIDRGKFVVNLGC